MNSIERTSVPFLHVDLTKLASKIELEEEVDEGEDGELHDIFAQSQEKPEKDEVKGDGFVPY